MKDFEEGMKRLEEIQERLSNSDVSLKNMLELYEEGMRLSQELSSELDTIERRVEILSKTPNQVQESTRTTSTQEPTTEFTLFDSKED